MKKKLFSLALAGVMLVSMVPSAFAAEWDNTFAELFGGWASEKDLTMTDLKIENKNDTSYSEIDEYSDSLFKFYSTSPKSGEPANDPYFAISSGMANAVMKQYNHPLENVKAVIKWGKTDCRKDSKISADDCASALKEEISKVENLKIYGRFHMELSAEVKNGELPTVSYSIPKGQYATFCIKLDDSDKVWSSLCGNDNNDKINVFMLRYACDQNSSEKPQITNAAFEKDEDGNGYLMFNASELIGDYVIVYADTNGAEVEETYSEASNSGTHDNTGTVTGTGDGGSIGGIVVAFFAVLGGLMAATGLLGK